MSDTLIKVFMIEDSPGEAKLIQRLLGEAEGVAFEIDHANTLAAGLQRLAERRVDVILLDLNLPDSRGMETLTEVCTLKPQAPIVIMTNMDQEQFVLEAMRRGAQDYLFKGQISTEILVRSIRYAIERKTDRLCAEERYHAVEESLRRERDLLKRIMETGAVGITVANRQGEIVFANATAARILGLSKDELTQRTYNAPAWRITDYEGQAVPDEELPFRQVIDAGQPVYDVRHAIALPGGERVFLSIDAAPLLDEAAQVERVVFTIKNVTAAVLADLELEKYRRHLEELVAQRTDELMALNRELKTEIQEHLKAEAAWRDAEELSKSILNSLTAYIAVVNQDGKVITANDAWQQLSADVHTAPLVYAPERHDYLEACRRAAAQDEQAARALTGIMTVLAGQADLFELEYIWQHAAQEQYFSLRVTPFRGKTQRGIVISYTDITERRLAQQAETEARAAAARAESQAREFNSLERLAVPRTGITSRLYGTIPLREAQPKLFEELVQEYTRLLDLALEQRVYKVEHHVSAGLRDMGERLGYLNARPRDVIEIHSTVLKLKTSKMNWTKAEAYAEEGRLMVLELMGYLVSFYRSYSLDFRRDLATNYRNFAKDGMISAEDD